MGYSPRGRKESEMTEWLHFSFSFSGTFWTNPFTSESPSSQI